jgi:hypothetical protein
MTTVRIAKAEDIGDRKIESCRIDIVDVIPNLGSRADHQAYFWLQGKTLAEVLFASLPGATVDTLIIRLLELTRLELHVPYPEQER